MQIDPNSAYAYYGRGNVYRALGDREASLIDFQKAATLYQQQGYREEYQDVLNQITGLTQ
jgi:tetratricopeptide (TPR) repeat protein